MAKSSPTSELSGDPELSRGATRVWNWIGRLVAVAVVAATLGGCGGPRVYPVSGKIVWKDGKPATELEGALLIFDLPEKQTSAQGVVLADATFQLTTSKPNDGALPGKYKVLVTERRKAGSGPDPSEMAPGVMDIRFSDPSTSDLYATIEEKTNDITLTVERAKR
jgi:hypothetical protein